MTLKQGSKKAISKNKIVIVQFHKGSMVPESPPHEAMAIPQHVESAISTQCGRKADDNEKQSYMIWTGDSTGESFEGVRQTISRRDLQMTTRKNDRL